MSTNSCARQTVPRGVAQIGLELTVSVNQRVKFSMKSALEPLPLLSRSLSVGNPRHGVVFFVSMDGKFVYFCIFVQFDELRSSNSNPFDSRQLTSNISGISGQAGIRITRLIRGIYYSHERGIVVYQFCLCDLYFLPIFLFLSLSLPFNPLDG